MTHHVPTTPPPATHDLKAAYAWREGMVPRADGTLNNAPAWNGWALVEAYLAGYQAAVAALTPPPVTEWAGE